MLVMFTDYVHDVMKRLAVYEMIDDKQLYYGSIKGFRGVWAQGKTKRECAENLCEVLEEWLNIERPVC